MDRLLSTFSDEMKKVINLLSLVSLLSVSCSQSAEETILSEAVSDTLLLQNKEQIVEALGSPNKKQNRTGNFSAYYFEDSRGTLAVVTFNESKEAVEIVVCSESEPNKVLARILESSEWEQGIDRMFGNPVYNNRTNGYSIYTENSCTYLTTNWTNEN